MTGKAAGNDGRHGSSLADLISGKYVQYVSVCSGTEPYLFAGMFWVQLNLPDSVMSNIGSENSAV